MSSDIDKYNDLQLLFWSGESFDDNLQHVGKYKAAEACITDIKQINLLDLTRWHHKHKKYNGIIRIW